MAGEVAPGSDGGVPAPPYANGTNGGAYERHKDTLMMWSFIGCVAIMGALAGFCLVKPPEEWNLINTVIGILKDFGLIILGRYAGTVRK